MPAKRSDRRARLAGPLAGLAVVLAMLALVLSYAGRSVLQAEPFADRVVATHKRLKGDLRETFFREQVAHDCVVIQRFRERRRVLDGVAGFRCTRNSG